MVFHSLLQQFVPLISYPRSKIVCSLYPLESFPVLINLILLLWITEESLALFSQ